MTTQGPAMLDMLFDSGGSTGIGCDSSKRIPRPAHPFYATSFEATIAVGADTPEDKNALSFLAEVSTMFEELTIEIYDAVGARYPGKFSLTYCNTVYAQDADLEDFQACCQRKPLFPVSVEENKRLRFAVKSDAPASLATGPLTVQVTMSGVQGEGCC